MIRFGSLQKDYDFFTSADPAFVKPPEPPADDATDEEREAHKKAREEYAAKWKAARETQNYAPLIIEGQQPTKFVLGRVSRTIWRSIQDRATLPDDNPRHIGFTAMLALLARLALRAIPSTDTKLHHAPDPQWDDWPMVPASAIDLLDEIDPRIVGEIGVEVLRRLQLTQGASPS